MQGKTHLAVGGFAAAIIARPSTVSEAVVCSCTAAVGALISDVDVTHSEAKNRLDHIVSMIVGAVVLGIAVNKLFGINAYDYLVRNSNLFRLISGILVFIGICIFGEKTPHRSFMHSAVGVAALSLAVSLISVDLLKFFVPAMLSHIAIDTLNKKRVQILYPLKKGISFRLCKSDGLVNKILFYAASAGYCGTIALSLFAG